MTKNFTFSPEEFSAMSTDVRNLGRIVMDPDFTRDTLRKEVDLIIKALEKKNSGEQYVKQINFAI